MNHQPCPSCRRHVRADSLTCPFCASAIETAAPEWVEAPRLLRGALMTFASAGFAATLGACYGGAPRYHEYGPPQQPSPELLSVSGDSLEACNKVIAEAKANGCYVTEAGGGIADISCKDLNVRIEPRAGAISLRCSEPYGNCRSGVEKLLSPAAAPSSNPPPVQPIAPP